MRFDNMMVSSMACEALSSGVGWCVRILSILSSLRLGGVVCGQVGGPEHELYADLFTGYSPDSRPVKNASHTVVVTFSLSLNQLLDLDEKNQVLSTSIWIYEEWRDEMLTWSPSEYSGQQALMIPATSIWLPDIFIFNTASDGVHGFVNVNGSKVAIRHDGQVRWMIPLMVSSACAVDVTYFPYDRQTCSIQFGSWIYDNHQLDIIADATEPDMENYVMNSEYDLSNVSMASGVLDSSCCPGEGSHPIVELTISLRRKSLYYDYIVIAPTIMLCVLTLASFLLPCDRGEKMAIGLTVFLTLYVLQLRIADNVPDTNAMPILGVFMLIVMTFNCVSLIMATIVMNIKKRGDDATAPDVPVWLFALCHHVFGRIVCTRYLWGDDIYPPSFYPARGEETSPTTTTTSTSSTICGRLQKTHAPSNNKRHRRSKRRKTYIPCRQRDDDDSDNGEYDDDSCPDSPIFDFKARDLYLRNRKLQNVPTQRAETDTGTSGDGTEDENVIRPGLSEKGALLHSNCDLIEDCRCNRNVNHQRKASFNQRGLQGAHGISSTVDASPVDAKMALQTDYENTSPMSSQDDAETLTRRMYTMKRRWYYVAQVVDKFSFLVYLVLLTFSVFTVLFLIPVYFRNDN